MPRPTRKVATSHGTIAYWDTGGERPVVLLIHGNSSSKRIFEKQFASGLAERYRLIAPDLPGHGESDNAADPEGTYSITGFASAMIEAANACGLENAAMVGWSLGGHIALEMLARWPGAESAFIFGAPPVPNDPDRALSAFLPSEHMGLTFQESFTDEELDTFTAMNFLDARSVEPWMIEDAKRTDGRFRPIMFQSAMEGRNLDEEKIVSTCAKPLAMVHGEHDLYISLDFLRSITYRHLWGGEVQVVPGASHAPQWDRAEALNKTLEAFLREPGHGGA